MLNTSRMRIQALLPYIIGFGLAVSGLALYFWLTTPDVPTRGGDLGLPDVYNVL